MPCPAGARRDAPTGKPTGKPTGMPVRFPGSSPQRSLKVSSMLSRLAGALPKGAAAGGLRGEMGAVPFLPVNVRVGQTQCSAEQKEKTAGQRGDGKKSKATIRKMLAFSMPERCCLSRRGKQYREKSRFSPGFSPGFFPWAFSVGFLRGLSPWAFSVGFFRGLSPWAFSVGFFRGLFPWAFSVGFSGGISEGFSWGFFSGASPGAFRDSLPWRCPAWYCGWSEAAWLAGKRTSRGKQRRLFSETGTGRIAGTAKR